MGINSWKDMEELEDSYSVTAGKVRKLSLQKLLKQKTLSKLQKWLKKNYE